MYVGSSLFVFACEGRGELFMVCAASPLISAGLPLLNRIKWESIPDAFSLFFGVVVFVALVVL